MPKADVAGARITLDTQEFVMGALEARRAITQINADFREATSGMVDWRKNIDGVTYKLVELNELVDVNTKAMNEYIRRQQSMGARTEENKNSYDKLTASIQRQRTEINKLNRDIGVYTGILNQLTNEENRASLKLDEFNKHIQKQGFNITSLQKDFEAGQYGMRLWENSLDGFSAKMDNLNEIIQIQNRIVDDYQKKIERVSRNPFGTDEDVQKLRKEYDDARVTLNKYRKELTDVEQKLEAFNLEQQKLEDEAREARRPVNLLTLEIKEQEDELAKLILDYKDIVATSGSWSHEAKELEKRIKFLNDELQENRNLLNLVNGADPFAEVVSPVGTLPEDTGRGFTIGRGILSNIASDLILSGFHRLGDAFREVIDTGIEFESAFMGVRRTVEGSEEDFRVLRNELLAMGSSVTSSITDIANIASLAGQMGIPVEQISEFTRVMIMLGDTTNITAEEAGDSLARLANLLNLTTDDFERMGSTIVQLGNEFPTTESEIAAMASRLAGTANMLNISAEDVFGLANAISALGLEAEMGGNAVSKTLREMQLAVENGTERLDIFARVSGMAVDDFVNMFTHDATEAFRRFVNGLSNQSESVIQILSNLNITELRQVDTLSRLATNTDTLNQSLEVAKTAWDENIALSVEAGKRYSTTESQIEFMKNAWEQTSVTITDKMNPAIRWGVGLLTDFAEWLNGNKLASEQLDRSLDILTSSLAQVAEQQKTLKGAIDDTNYSMYVQGIIATNDAMVNSAGQLTDSLDNASNAYRRLFDESYTDPTGTYDENLISVLDNSRKALMDYAEEFGYSTYDELIKAYYAGSDEFLNGFGISMRENIGDAISQFNMATNDVNLAYKTINDNVSSVMNFSKGLNELLNQNVITMEQVSVLSSMMGDGYDTIVYNLVSGFQNQKGDADSWAYNFIQSVQGDKDAVGDAVESMTDEINRLFVGLANPETRDQINLNLLALLLLEKNYLTSWQENLEEGIDKNNELADDYSQSVIKFADLRKGFEDSLTETSRLSSLLGLSEEESDKALMSVYDAYIRNLNSQLTEYDNTLNTLADTDERYKQTLIERKLVEAELDSISKERNERFAKYISEETEYARIQTEYRDGIRKIAEQERILGDAFDETGARAQLAQRTFESIIALNPEERGEGWETFLSTLVYWMQKANEEASELLSDAERIIERFTSAENIEASLGLISDPTVLNSLKSNIGYTSQSVIREILGLGDLEEAVENGEISQEIADTLNQILIDAQENVALYGNKDNPVDTYSWWDKFLDRDEISDKQKEITDGLEDMMSDIQSIFDSIGQSIFDMIDQSIQNQIDQIDNEIDHLDNLLEEEQAKIEQNRSINENMLRKQLQEGVIDEETYYRESAKNKYDAEAQKQKAEEETHAKKKSLMQQQDALERKQFESNKANQIAQIIMDTASAIIKSSTSLPWPWNLIPMNAMAGIGAAQLAVASAQQYTPALATGGIVTAPTTALIGEAGKEAVLPLEQNTDWMDELAYRIGSIVTSDRIRTAIDRTLNEDGRTVDETKNMQFTQIINSPKALSRKEIYRDTRRLVRMVDRRTN